jgi:hypothetical protein
MQPQFDNEFDERPDTQENSQTKKVNLNEVHDFDFRDVEDDLSTATPLGGPCILFYLPDMRDPIKFVNTDLIIFGRRDKRNKFTPTVDLTEHHGSLLGVSRQHAKVVFYEGDFYVTDLGSTNGTWVNDRPVDTDDTVKLTAGDLLRLGHLIIYIGGCGNTF